MRSNYTLTAVLLFVAGICNLCGQAASGNGPAKRPPASIHLIPVSVLEAEGRASTSAQPRVSVEGDGNGLIAAVDDLEPSGTGRVPNFVRAFSGRPGVPASVAHLMRVVLYSGSVRPETKMAMGIRVAQLDNSPYVAAYLEHMLRATGGGTSTLARLRSGGEAGLSHEEEWRFVMRQQCPQMRVGSRIRNTAGSEPFSTTRRGGTHAFRVLLQLLHQDGQRIQPAG